MACVMKKSLACLGLLFLSVLAFAAALASFDAALVNVENYILASCLAILTLVLGMLSIVSITAVGLLVFGTEDANTQHRRMTSNEDHQP